MAAFQVREILRSLALFAPGIAINHGKSTWNRTPRFGTITYLAVGRGEPGVLCGSCTMAPTSQPPDRSTVPDPHSCHIERRADGAVLVRVRSRVVEGRSLPDAVFAFRAGDPQYGYWVEQLRAREAIAAPTILLPLPTYEPS